ncbi:MAG: MATE family efflux transporter [Lachnospiraceae bacterium]|nr:MATE family efflux transporter [Lachnospiraceae bacterium]
MIQQGITNFVNMLDNIMIGRVGTDEMSGVAIVNELLFVFNLCIFGGVAGIGIFTSQIYGKGDEKGVRYTMRLQLMFALVIVGAGYLILSLFGDSLIPLFLTDDGGAGDVERTYAFAMTYLQLMFIGFIPFGLAQGYASTLRACGETRLPMMSGVIAVVVNLVGNYVLIYGKAGFPALGVAGAAIATVLSRFVEMAYIVVRTHARVKMYPFVKGLYRSLYVPLDLVKKCLSKGLPLMLNEALWAGGMATLTQNYSLRGLSVIAAMNITLTISNVFNISFIAMGNAIGIILGQLLGADKLAQAKEDATKLTVFSTLICVATGAVLFLVASLFPQFYNTTDDIRAIATSLIRVCAACMPLYAIANAAYFILRSGGKILVTFLFDAFFVWVCQIPTAAGLVRFTPWSVLLVFLTVELLNVVKCVVGMTLVHKGVWVRNIAAYEE